MSVNLQMGAKQRCAHKVQGHGVVDAVVDSWVRDAGVCVDALVGAKLTVVNGHDDSRSGEVEWVKLVGKGDGVVESGG